MNRAKECDSLQAVNLPEYREQVGRIPYGKRLPTALYVHREGLVHLDGTLGAVLDRVVARYQVSTEFNLVKFRTDELKLSFLAYGCGQGSDVKGLQGLGYQAEGWDPVFRPETPKREADVVNLG